MKIARQWKEMVVWHVGNKRPEKPLSVPKITIIRMSSSQPDYDGLVSSGKHLLDGLIVARVLDDDKHVRPNYLWEKCPSKEGRMRIIVEEED